MLTHSENDRLCRVGPQTPMGRLMRRYWIPVNYCWETEANGQAVRVRILGEDLLAWRDSDGTPVFSQERCPHRQASFYFGRCEDGVIRCPYHGWAFDRQGNCRETPNEPDGSRLKERVKIVTYKAVDFGGLTWIYMGDRQDDPPGVPDFEWAAVPDNQRLHNQKQVMLFNWLQALESELDSTHVHFLHGRLNRDDSPRYGVWHDQPNAKLHVVDAPHGLTYGAERGEENGHRYWRTAHFLHPFYGMFPANPRGRVNVSIYVPIDDEHTLNLEVRWHPTEALSLSGRPPAELADEPGVLSKGIGPMKPAQKGRFFANWWPQVCAETDFHMDLHAKRTRNKTGIPGVRLQDVAILSSMGSIVDRSQENLGASDAAIIKMRKLQLAALAAFEADGQEPPGVLNPGMYRMRSCATALPCGADWLVELNDWHHAKALVVPTGGLPRDLPTLVQAGPH